MSILAYILCHVTFWDLHSSLILEELHDTQDTNFVYVNIWPRLGLGQLVYLQFPAAKCLNLGLRKSHDMQVYMVVVLTGLEITYP